MKPSHFLIFSNSSNFILNSRSVSLNVLFHFIFVHFLLTKKILYTFKWLLF